MGWDSSLNWTKKADAIADVTKQLLGCGWSILGHASTASGAFWAVTSDRGETFIYCACVEKHGHQILIKTMTEEAGPFMFDCPLRLLNMVPATTNQWAIDWRLAVREYHARKTLDLMGKTIALHSTGPKYLVDRKHANGYLITREDGARFKLTKKQQLTCIILEPDLRTIVQFIVNKDKAA